MIFRLITYGTDEYREMVELRTRVLREPLGLVFGEQDLLRDINDLLCGCFDAGKLIGTCIITPRNNEVVQLRQMAIDLECQGKGIGIMLLHFAEETVSEHHYSKIILHARKPAIGFYRKAGYKVTGDEFLEVGISHYMMEKEFSDK